MSVPIRPGESMVMDPNDKLVLTWDWEILDNLPPAATIVTSSFSIDAIRQNGATPLSKDNETIVSGSRKTQLRILSTTATKGDRYRVNNLIITNESPDQQKERSIYVLVQQK